MTIREQLEAEEYRRLSPYAAKSAEAERVYPMEPCPIRTQFQRDRDRILHCKAFRRLKHKTQVFLSPEGDHYRTRLTHTLEVAQIARTITRALRLNEDLAEAIALGHDLGHTPYGHAGEDALDECCPHGFVHAQQSVRVVSALENNGEGLNLTNAVRNGILCHSSGKAETLEGRVVLYADKIAYMNHDIEDAVRAGIITEQDIPAAVVRTVGDTKSRRIDSFVRSIIEESGEEIQMSPEVSESFHLLREFLFANVYRNSTAKGEEKKAKQMLTLLYHHFLKHPDRLPREYLAIASAQDIDRAVCDYISGMTDRYAIAVFDSIFVPRSWGG